jgi:hypothetical protein
MKNTIIGKFFCYIFSDEFSNIIIRLFLAWVLLLLLLGFCFLKLTFILDLIFRLASIDSLFSYIASPFIAIPLIKFLVNGLKRNREYIKKMDEKIDNDRQLLDNIQTDENNVIIISESSVSMKKSLQKQKQKRHLLMIEYREGIWAFIFLLLLLIMTVFIPFLLKRHFNNSIDRITSYSDTKTINELKSDWRQMKSENECRNICDRINCIIKKNELN